MLEFGLLLFSPTNYSPDLLSLNQTLSHSVEYDLDKLAEKVKEYCDMLTVLVQLWSDEYDTYCILFDFSLTVKAAPHECVIRTGQPKT